MASIEKNFKQNFQVKGLGTFLVLIKNSFAATIFSEIAGLVKPRYQILIITVNHQEIQYNKTTINIKCHGLSHNFMTIQKYLY